MAPSGVASKEPDRRLRPKDKLSSAEIKRVFRDGASQAGALVVLFVLSSEDLDRKVAFVASRRVGNAVRRNRAKRLMREAFRIHKEQVPAKGYQLVLVARQGCPDARFDEVERDYLKLIARKGFEAREGTPGQEGNR